VTGLVLRRHFVNRSRRRPRPRPRFRGRVTSGAYGTNPELASKGLQKRVGCSPFEDEDDDGKSLDLTLDTALSFDKPDRFSIVIKF
jgi:hypothetical protein